MNTVNMIYADDWQGLYLNGILYSEGHSIKIYEIGHIINKLGGISEFFENEVCVEWMYDMGYLPKFFTDIPKDVFQ